MDFRKLKAFNELAARHIDRFGTHEDFAILLEIASHQQQGNSLTLKQLVLCSAVPESTLKRRLGRLVRQKYVDKKVTDADRRVHGYSLPEKTIRSLHDLMRDLRVYQWD
jgi:DNA-binding MarR family transcriptional regulator